MRRAWYVLSLLGSACFWLTGCPGGHHSSASPEVAGALAPVSIYPSDGASGIPTTADLKASFPSAMQASFATPAFFQLFLGGSKAVAGKVWMENEDKTLVFSPAEPLLPGKPYRLILTAGIQDLKGFQIESDISVFFYTAAESEQKALEIVGVTPAPGATAVPPAAWAIVVFSKPIASQTLSPENLHIADPSGSNVPAQIQSDGPQVVLIPDEPLLGETLYLVRIETGVKDVQGNALAEPFEWNFATHETVKPFVAQADPAPGISGAPLTSAVSVTFSEAMDPATLGPGTFSLVDEYGNPFSGDLGYEPSTFALTFVPDQPLTLSLFAVTIAASAADLVGNSLGTDYTWSFDTLTGEWSAPEALQEPGASVFQGLVEGSASDGRAIAAWNQMKPGYAVHAKTYDPLKGWSNGQQVSSGLAFVVDEFRLAMDAASGEATLVWDQKPPIEVFSAGLVAGSSIWNSPSLLGLGNAEGMMPRIALAPTAKTAHSIWLDKDSPLKAHSLHHSFQAAYGWTAPQEAFSPIGYGDPNYLEIVADSKTGNAFVVWIERAPGDLFHNVYLSRYDFSFGVWENPPTRVSDDVSDCAGLTIAPDPSTGSAWLLYLQKGNAEQNANVRAILLPPLSASLPPATRLSEDSAVCSYPSVAADADGKTFAVWLEGSSASPLAVKSIFSAYKPKDLPWEPPQEVLPALAPCKDPRLVSGETSGAAYLVWAQQAPGDSAPNVYFSERVPVSGEWNSPLRLSVDGDPCYYPQIAAISKKGVATLIAIWVQGPDANSRSLVARVRKSEE